MSEPDAHGWLPIETAPKDGTVVLVWTTTENSKDEGYIRDICNGEHHLCAQTGWFNEDRNEWEAAFIGHPTHWQPLPLPPTPPTFGDGQTPL